MISRASAPGPRSDNELLREIAETLQDIKKILQNAAQQPDAAARPPEVKR